MQSRVEIEALPDHGMREFHYSANDIVDPFIDPEGFEKVSGIIEELSAMGYYGDSTVDLSRKRRGDIDGANLATKKMIEYIPSSEYWLEQVPTVMALESLYDPQAEHYANGKKVSPEARVWLSNCLDGVGIRNRGQLTQRVIIREQPKRIVSLGSGAGRSVFAAARTLRNMTGRPPETIMVDYDPNALDLSRSNAEKYNLGATTRLRRKNILGRRQVAGNNIVERALYNKAGLARQSAGVVDIIGVTEYLQEGDWEYKYNGVVAPTKKPMAGAVTFLRNAYDLVSPGGVLLVGNMLDTHPQLGFTLNVVQWPHIQPRSIEQMSELFDKANLSADREAHLSADGVYGVYVIRKPDESYYN